MKVYWGPRELRERVGRAEASNAQCRRATVNARDCRTRGGDEVIYFGELSIGGYVRGNEIYKISRAKRVGNYISLANCQ